MARSRLFLGFLAALSLRNVLAGPLLDKRCVVSPHILTPTDGTVWTAGQPANCTWDISSLPDCPISNRAILQLVICSGNYTPSTDTEPARCSPRQAIQPYLAEDFDLTAGIVNFTVPANVTAGSNYSIVLFGDSGNLSNQFTIQASNSTSNSTSANGSSSDGSDSSSDGSGDDCGDSDDGSGSGRLRAARAALREEVWADL